jgi:hypothetical protein
MHRFPYSSLSWLFVLISVSECLPTFFSSLVFACSYLCCLLFSSSVCSLFILIILVRRLTCSLLFVVVVLVARLDLRWGVSWSLVSFSSLVLSVSYFPLSFFFIFIPVCISFFLFVIWISRFNYSSSSWVFVSIRDRECLALLFFSRLRLHSIFCIFCFRHAPACLLIPLARRLNSSLPFVVVVLVSRLDLW